ncbi:hypothetical protein [Pedobacter cryoconitis]|uniref:Putative RDD family membrane protein YckC n=1 Tax=Pedobacter cryoconitis TaxID=188932 RepID=A0A7X0J2Q5_9SPHI|nr:hypothetical protein [Pedobacter cryoconitis]MBB6498536.1 putative RDD family membrane protein YckC [Pedobacter cryoconitis]
MKTKYIPISRYAIISMVLFLFFLFLYIVATGLLEPWLKGWLEVSFAILVLLSFAGSVISAVMAVSINKKSLSGWVMCFIISVFLVCLVFLLRDLPFH